MSRTLRRRNRPTLNRPLWDRLESRIVLSSVIGSDPAPGAVLASSPETVRILFDSPIDPFSLGFQDVVVDRVANDGTLSPAFDHADIPFEDIDPDGTVLSLALARTLGPGHYRLVLVGGSGLVGVDGSSVANTDGTDQPIADFTIARPGVGLSDAVDLGAINTQVRDVAGDLNFTANPGDVRLYKITLTPGHVWRLGLEVTAQRDGSSLNSALALFDAQGRPLATSEVGRPDAPSDPFLFVGLKPGTYYVGVSGTGDLPGQAGGYDIAAALAGPEQTQAGGEFRLHLVADAADLPGALTGFHVIHADPLDLTPTGFTLRFSTPLDLGASGAEVFNKSTGGVELVDQNGRSWKVAAVNYDAEHSALSFLFLDRLPQGTYSLRMNAARPLVDLAGITPTSPGMPRGVLATFTVAPDVRAHQADGTLAIPPELLVGQDVTNPDWADKAHSEVTRSEDLGPLTPNLVLNGIERTFTIQPGETVAFRFVSLYEDFYKLMVNYRGAGLEVDMDGGDGMACDIDPGPEGQDNSQLTQLQTGQYIVRFTATGDKPITVTARVSIGAFSWDSLLANGLGQGPALNLRLISTDGSTTFTLADAPSGGFAGLNSGSTSRGGPGAGPYVQPSTAPLSALLGAIASTEIVTTGPGVAARPAPSGLAFDVGGVPVGHPSLSADHVAAVGPPIGGNGTALASAGGPGQSIAAAGSHLGAFRPSYDGPEVAEPQTPEPTTDGSMSPAPSDGEAPPDGPAEESTRGTIDPDVLRTSGDQDRADGVPETGAAPAAPALAKSETETPEVKAGMLPWAAAILGGAAIAARWVHHRASARRPKAVITTKRIPAPHTSVARVRVR